MPKISDIPYQTRSWSVPARGYQNWTKAPDYEECELSLPEGVASIYIQGGVTTTHHTYIAFVHNGYRYTRSWSHRFTRPTAVRLARQLIADITRPQEQPHP